VVPISKTMKYMIGVDIGTTSTKAVLYDEKGQFIMFHNKLPFFIIKHCFCTFITYINTYHVFHIFSSYCTSYFTITLSSKNYLYFRQHYQILNEMFLFVFMHFTFNLL